MSLFSFNSPKTEKVLFFDLKSESLSCSMVGFSDEEKPEIIFYEKINFADSTTFGIKKYLLSMVESFENISKRVRGKYLSPSGILKKVYKVDNICVSISSPWILSKSKYVSIKKDRPFLIDGKFLSDLKTPNIQDVLNFSPHRKDKEKDKIKIFEEHIVQTKLNGYKIEKIKDKSVTSFEANLFLSVIQTDILQKITSAISKNIVSKGNYFHSFILSGFSFVRDAYPAKDDFIFLDIGGEITEVCVAQDDAVEKIFTFPFGKRAILKKVSDELKIPEDMALSMINMKCHGNCDNKTSEQVEKAINLAVDSWTESLFEIFREISPQGDIPKDIFLVSDDEILSVISKKISENKLKGLNIVDNEFRIMLLDNRKFLPFFKKQEISTDDVHLRLAIILIDKFFKNKSLSR